MENTGLEGMTWHLRKTNWMGEPADCLNDEDATLGNENIKNGDTLIVEEGRLPPKGFIRLSLWQTPSVGPVDFISWISSGVQGLLGSASVTNASENRGDNLEVTGCLLAIGDIEISYDATLYDLKLQISTLPKLADHVIPTPGFLRLQEVVDGQQTRVLRGISRTLRQLKLTSSTQLSVRVLQQEEDLSACAVLLRLKRRIPGKRLYSAEEEVIYEPTGGATPLSLRQFVSNVCDIPLDRLNVAKYFRAKYHWLVIKNAPGNQGSKGRKKKVNLRQSPFHLQDGDIIGVKDCYLDPDQDKDDFSTPADDEGKERLKREEEEKRRRRTEKRTRRPEVPLTIHVDDFR